MGVEGIDVSNNQGSLNWAAIAAAGKRFAFIKASEGTWFHDSWFPTNWAAAAANQLWRGAYHFARPGHAGTGADEANYFCDYVLSQPVLQGDMYALDLEVGPPHADLAAYTLDWCQTVEARTGVKPLIYSAQYMLNDWKLTHRDDIAQYGLWLASWGPTSFPAPLPNWPCLAFWQYDDHGRCPGVSGDCDLDRFNGDETALAAYGVQ